MVTISTRLQLGCWAGLKRGHKIARNEIGKGKLEDNEMYICGIFGASRPIGIEAVAVALLVSEYPTKM